MEPTAALTGAAAVMAFMYFARTSATAALVWAVAVAAFAMQFRPESLLLAPLLAVGLVLWRPEEVQRLRFWSAGLLGLTLSSALVAHSVAVSNEGWGASGDRFSWAFVLDNLRVNGGFYLWDERFPVLYTVLAVAGVVLAGSWRARLFALTHFGLFWAVFLGFYAGSYDYGVDVRYSLLSYAPLAVLAGAGIDALLRRGASYDEWRRYGAAGFAALLAFNFLIYLPQVRSVGEESWAARADVAFARRITEDLPPNAMLLTHNPNMFLLWGQNAAQTYIGASETPLVREHYLQRYAGGVYFHWNFWCNVNDPVQRALCDQVLQKYDVSLMREHRERDYRYALYRLNGPRGEIE